MLRKKPPRRLLRRQLLQLLQTDSSKANVTLAKELGVLPPTVSRLRTELERKKFILGYKAMLNPKMLGLRTLAFIQIALEDERAFPKTQRMLQEAPEVQEIHAIQGEFDFLVKLRVHSNEVVFSFVKEHLTSRHNIKRTNTVIVMQSLKEKTELPLQENKSDYVDADEL